MICSLSCPDWRLRCILFACPELSEILDRIDKDIDCQRECIRREMDERIERYLGRRRP
jgi:hypothetical protein